MTKRSFLFRLVGSLSLSLLVVGCGTTRDAQWNDDADRASAPAEVDQAAALVSEGDALWAERSEKAKLEQALIKWEEAGKLEPSGELYVKLARGHYFLGDTHYHLAGEVEKRDEHYTTGLDYAERALKLQAPEFVAAMKSGASHQEAITKAPKEAVPAMYWYATNLGRWAVSKGFATLLRYKDGIKATMDHIMALSPDYFYAAPYRYFGAYEARTAGMAGGSLEKSQKMFEEAAAKAPDYLGTKVLWAQYLTVKQGAEGREKYKELLEQVIAADPAALPEIEPENRMEQAKAKLLLAKIDDMF